MEHYYLECLCKKKEKCTCICLRCNLPKLNTTTYCPEFIVPNNVKKRVTSGYLDFNSYGEWENLV